MKAPIHTLSASQIIVKDRLRPADPAWVEALAAMIEEGGQQQPIVLRIKNGAPHLVIGLHRLEGLIKNGVEPLVEGVNYVIKEMTDDQARMAEIDENLGRNDLSPLDRALHLAERKAVYERLYPETAHGKAKKSKTERVEEKSQSLRLSVLPKRFSLEAADKTGLSERAVQLSLELAEKLSPKAIDRLRGTGIERNQAALLAIAAETAPNQFRIADRIAKGEAPTVAKAKEDLKLVEPTVRDEQARALANLQNAWRIANARTRKTFLDFIKKEGGK